MTLALLFSVVMILVIAYSTGIGIVERFSAEPEKKKKCEKCKKEEPIEGSKLCYYCEIVEFRQFQKAAHKNSS